ncbi:hypothetical protein CYMTET_33162 [Cymbomonas tetramitiformis]|uniref:Uncharacterized protein n=1 Tax=Cymbomonas tetramitiformis TaxID=36881 RepID=A0AAE0KRH2_9CHLO|nr:hypothetical protein CYMTET_33162 [Cymbomonas tetramitiformis]
MPAPSRKNADPKAQEAGRRAATRSEGSRSGAQGSYKIKEGFQEAGAGGYKIRGSSGRRAATTASEGSEAGRTAARKIEAQKRGAGYNIRGLKKPGAQGGYRSGEAPAVQEATTTSEKHHKEVVQAARQGSRSGAQGSPTRLLSNCI